MRPVNFGILTAVLFVTALASTADAGGYVWRHRGPGFVARRTYVYTTPRRIYLSRPAPIITPVVTAPPIVVRPVIHEPSQRYVIVGPRDTLYRIAAREYGDGSMWPHIARFNGISRASEFRTGLRLALPRIEFDGTTTLVGSASAPPTAGLATTAAAHFE